MSQERDRQMEKAHGGVVSRHGDIVTLGDGAQWWLVGEQWARDETDAIISRERNVMRIGGRLS